MGQAQEGQAPTGEGQRGAFQGEGREAWGLGQNPGPQDGRTLLGAVGRALEEEDPLGPHPLLPRLALALGGLYALGWSLAGFGESLGQGLLRLEVLAPLGFLLYAIWVRILLEASVSLIRVAQNTSDILEELRKKP